tara:strand:- start:5 stop:196 length:192 start_codon:yes stop_codon:yes gene_type:complete
MDINQNITNVKQRLVELEGEGKRLLGMLEVLENIKNLGVTVIKKEEEDVDIVVEEEVIDGGDL